MGGFKMRGKFWAAAAALVVAVMGVVPAYAVDAGVLWNEFTNNEGAFKQKYKGVPVTISGKVWSVDTENLPASIVLRGADEGGYGTRVYCVLSDKNQAMRVSKDDAITVAGTFWTAGGVGIYFKPCSVR
jgi:hypothetical protein